MTVNDLFDLIDLIDGDQDVFCDFKWHINEYKTISVFAADRQQMLPIVKGFSIEYDFIVKHIKIKTYHYEDDTYDYVLDVDVEPPTGGYND